MFEALSLLTVPYVGVAPEDQNASLGTKIPGSTSKGPTHAAYRRT